MAKTFKELKIGDTIWMVYDKGFPVPELIELTIWCDSKVSPEQSGSCRFYYKHPDKKSKYSLMVGETADSVYINNNMLITTNREKAIEKQKDCARIQLKRYLKLVEVTQDKIEKLLMILEED